MLKHIAQKILIAILLSLSTQVWATTYYLRGDGGTSSQCDGIHDAAYPGSGTGQACAFNHPYYLIRHGIDDTGTYGGTTVMSAGDTVIVGAPDGAGGSTDQFKMGYDSIWSGCYQAAAYGCWLDNIPAGVDSSHKTKVYGRGYDTGCTGNRAQLWGTEKVRSVLRVVGNTEVQCLDITDHSACMGDGVPGTVDGEAVACNDSTTPYGTHGVDGIWLTGSGNYLKWIWSHGHNRYGMTTAGDFGDNTIELSDFDNNGYGGVSTGPSDVGTGKMTFIDTNAEGNGCGERYPLQSTTKNSSLNWHHCSSQGQNGAASPDGVAFGNETSSANAGSWDFIRGHYSHNAGDGIDTLHGNGNGTIYMGGVTAEGNGGNQVKLNALFGYIENSKLIGNCGFFHGQSFTSTKATYGDSGSCTTNGGSWNGTDCDYPFLDCRANGETISLALSNDTKFYIYNNTILASGYGAILSGDHQGIGCNGGTAVTAKNNIVYGGWVFPDDSAINGAGGDRRPYLYYASGIDGDGGGTCGSITMSTQNNLVFQTSSSTTNCGGTGDICASDPLFAGTIKQGHGSVSSYYQGTDYAAQIDLTSSSPARNAADNSITCHGDCSVDFNAVSRGTSWDIGAVEYGSGDGGIPDPSSNPFIIRGGVTITGRVTIGGGGQ